MTGFNQMLHEIGASDAPGEALPTTCVLGVSTAEAIGAVEQALHHEGWVVGRVCEPDAVEEFARHRSCRVGLVILSGAEPAAWLDQVCTSPSGSTMEWVAVVTPGALENRHCAEVVFSRCFDYHTMPVRGEHLALTLGHAQGMAELAEHHAVAPPARGGAARVTSRSSKMRATLRQAKKMAAADLPLLITGESGSGKEEIAREVHRLSARGGEGFVAVNCAALAPSLVQSELFGHEKGAFTGAHQRKIGRIEMASGGTILLDEVGDLPENVQVSLLRFLENGAIERVGSGLSIHLDARVIAATHVNLEEAVSKGRFREDLFYRLDVLRLKVPPLRQRLEDLRDLAEQFLDEYSREHGGRTCGFSDDALLAMEQYDWPGNVRELQNRVRQAVVLAEQRLVFRQDLRLDRRGARRQLSTLKDARETAERQALLASIRWARGNVTVAAKSLGISRIHVYRLMQVHGIEPERLGRDDAD